MLYGTIRKLCTIRFTPSEKTLSISTHWFASKPAYYPETNPLVALSSHDKYAKIPASKSVPVILHPGNAPEQKCSGAFPGCKITGTLFEAGILAYLSWLLNATKGFEANQWVDIESVFSDGVKRIVHSFRIVPYNIPRGSLAAYISLVHK
jgi:hypothetical protein